MSKNLIRERALKEKLGGISTTTFRNRFRFHENAPVPIDTPDGRLAWWEHEWDAFLESLPRTDWPLDDVSGIPDHWNADPLPRLKRRAKVRRDKPVVDPDPPKAA